MRRMQAFYWIITVLLCAFLLGGCSSSASRGEDFYAFLSGEDSGEGFEPIYYENEFHESLRIREDICLSIDTANEGYIGISVESGAGIVVQLIREEIKYNFFVSAGEVSYLPLSLGEGEYKVRVMENTVGNKYVELGNVTIDAAFTTEYQPFLHSSMMTEYGESSLCVIKAKELAEEATSDLDFVRKVYAYVSELLRYDNQLAKTVAEGYIPDPDHTLESKKGICFDIASLTAAMLRSQGIPTKMVTGYVGEEALYHAWNSFYLEDRGWVSIEIQKPEDDWNLVDLTFVVTGADLDKVYVDRYIY